MDRLLEAWLAVRAPRDPAIGPDPAAAKALDDELLWLSALTTRELGAKLACLQADFGELQEEAAWVTRRLAEAEQALKKLELIAARRAQRADDGPVDAPADHLREQRGDPPNTANTPTETAREAVLTLLREDPNHPWTPQLAYDELRRRGRSFSRTAVQTALQRMAADGRLVHRVRPGAYQPVSESARAVKDQVVHEKAATGAGEPAVAANGHVPAGWLTSEVVQRVAEEARTRFEAQHPGTADRDVLVAEAKRRVEVWIERHSRVPDDEAHLRRLMKTALHDHYRHLQRNGSKPDTDAEVKEEAD
jgi:hypothetical protein